MIVVSLPLSYPLRNHQTLNGHKRSFITLILNGLKLTFIIPTLNGHKRSFITLILNGLKLTFINLILNGLKLAFITADGEWV